MNKNSKTGLLCSFRVLDLSDEKGTICGFILAQLGAEVVKIEPLCGGKERKKGPFAAGQENAEKSLFWLAFNRGKKGITLDLEDNNGKTIFKELVQNADMIIESFPPGYMEDCGFGYPVLSELNPGIVLVSISPFGQTGPYKSYEGSDLVVTALSGFLYLCGDTDRAPVRVSYPLSYGYAATNAAAASVMALYEREMSGAGQHVDVSAQEAMTEFTLMAPTFWDAMKTIPKRAGQSRGGGSLSIRDTWECKDGWVAFSIYGGEFGGRMNKILMDWLEKEGLCTENLKVLDWYNFDLAKASEEVVKEIEECIGNFFKRHTRAELFQGCTERGVNLCPVWNSSDLLDFGHLKERDYWAKIVHPELGMSLNHTGPLFFSPDGDGLSKEPAPELGQHNEEIYSKLLNYSETKIERLKKQGVI